MGSLVHSWKGIDPFVLDEAGIEYDEERGAICIPYRRSDGSVHRWRYYRSSGSGWWEGAGGLTPFGLETLPVDSDREGWLVICEGESDALAFRQAYHDPAEPGARVPSVLGVPGVNTWQLGWGMLCDGFGVIYVVGDGDTPGRKFNDRVLTDLSQARIVPIPTGEDARSVLQEADGRARMDNMLAEADYRTYLYPAFRRSASWEQFVAAMAELTVSRAC